MATKLYFTAELDWTFNNFNNVCTSNLQNSTNLTTIRAAIINRNKKKC